MIQIPVGNLFSAGGHLRLNNRLSFFVNGLYFEQESYGSTIVGGYARYRLNALEKTEPGDLAVYLGGWVSSGAATPYVGLEAGKCRFGFSYDNHRRYPGRIRAFELSLIFTTNRHKQTTTPIPISTDPTALPLAPPARWNCPTMF